MRRLLPRAMLFGLLVACGAHAQPAAADQEREEVFYGLGAVEVLGDAADYVEVGAGVFDVFAADTDDIDGDRSAAAYLELRLGEKVAFLGPAIGLMANTDGGVFGYGAVYAELAYRPSS